MRSPHRQKESAKKKKGRRSRPFHYRLSQF
jgi:hypothetical protein